VVEVPAAWIRHAADELGSASPVMTGAMRAANLSPKLLTDDSQRVRARAFVEFIDRAAKLAENDLLGLTLGQSYDLRASGLAAYTAIAAATLREAMQNAVRYGSMNDTSAHYALVENNNHATFVMESEDAAMHQCRQANEFKVAFIVAACRRLLGDGFHPVEVRFAHARADPPREIARYFTCPVVFGGYATEMIVTGEQLALPIRSADPYLHALVTRHVEGVLAARSHRTDSLRARVERLVVKALPKEPPSATEMAASLGIGERTFARRLASEGATYRRIVDEVRHDVARRYIEESELTFGQIAYLLGYAEQSAFTSAFRRWTGVSPRRFRARTLDLPDLAQNEG
jgi:AraC-like DNA-binding protein